MSHNFASLSLLPVARRVPVELNATELTPLLCPINVATHPFVFHNFTVLSALPVARNPVE